MSPGGSTPMSRRSRPELPPSSATVTTAVRLLVSSFRPPSSAARPVPPPMATTRGPAGEAAVEADLARRSGARTLRSARCRAAPSGDAAARPASTMPVADEQRGARQLVAHRAPSPAALSKVARHHEPTPDRAAKRDAARAHDAEQHQRLRPMPGYSHLEARARSVRRRHQSRAHVAVTHDGVVTLRRVALGHHSAMVTER